MKFLVIDFETNGLDPKTCNVTEYAYIYWDALSKRILKAESNLIGKGFGDSYPISDEVSDITGITPTLIREYGREETEEEFTRKIIPYLEGSDIVWAYNGDSFDYAVLLRLLNTILSNDAVFEILKKPIFADAMYSIPWPRILGSPQLGIVAQSHGVLNPCAHAAMGDVITLKSIIDKYDPFLLQEIAKTEDLYFFAESQNKEEWELIRNLGFKWDRYVEKELSIKIKSGMLHHFETWYKDRWRFHIWPVATRRVIVKADVVYLDRNLAKENGYRWDAEKRVWIKAMTEHMYYEHEKISMPFNTIILEDAPDLVVHS